MRAGDGLKHMNKNHETQWTKKSSNSQQLMLIKPTMQQNIHKPTQLILPDSRIIKYLALADMTQREPLGDPLLESGVNLNIGLPACQPELR